MRVEHLRLEKSGDRVKSIATVTWEDSNREPREIYFETSESFSRDLSSNPHAFLVACIMSAVHFGEKRLLINEEICPELKDGLINAMTWMRLWWYNPSTQIVKIESKTRETGRLEAHRPRAGFFFSGGIDAIATLRSNRIHYAPSHPLSIKDGLIVCGLEVTEPKAFEHVLGLVSELADEADVTLIPVYTNIRSLGPDNISQFWDDFWVKEFMGAAFAAIAHAFANRLSVVSISSDHDIPNIYPFSSHPLINCNYTSSDLRIRLEGISLSRFEKTGLVAGWDLALRKLRVCNKPQYYTPEKLNCGECEKCVRTMLTLKALGALEKATAFPYNDVTEAQIAKTGKLMPNTYFFWNQLISPLQEKGHHGLVRAVEDKIHRYHQEEKKKKLKNMLVKPIKEFDQRNLKGTLQRVKRMFS
jgi:hypothetical protein